MVHDPTCQRVASTPRFPYGRSTIFSVCCLLSLIILCSSAGVASDLNDPDLAIRRERPRFVCDTGAFWQDDKPFVAVEIGIPYRELMFRLDGDTYRASFDLIVVLYEGKRQVTGDLWNEKVETKSYPDTRGSEKSYRRGVTLPARPGNLRIEVTVSEQDSGNEGRLIQEVVVPDLAKEQLVIGKVWFGGCLSDTSVVTEVVPTEPLLSRRFGSSTGRVCAWSKIYNRTGETPDTIELEWLIRDERREVVREESLTLDSPPRDASLTIPLPVDELWLGRYELVLRTKVDGEEAGRFITFEMDETMVALHHSPSESIALVRYIAGGDEIEELEKATAEERPKVWEEFWKRRDPNPETEENEFKTEFFRRVRYANENFGSIVSGWKTDRGMIYIQYGTPDLVETYPHNIDGPPYEVWVYNSLPKRFVFVDYDGFGQYELYTPGRR